MQWPKTASSPCLGRPFVIINIVVSRMSTELLCEAGISAKTICREFADLAKIKLYKYLAFGLIAASPPLYYL